MKENKRIIKTLIAVSGLFIAMLSYLLYFNLFLAEDLRTKESQANQWTEEKFINRGNVFDSEGRIVAESVRVGDEVQRSYPYNRLFSHVVGYCSPAFGKTLLEESFDADLVARSNRNLFQGIEEQGFDLNLTINADYQQYVYDLMQGKNGAIVAMEPQSGKILAMVSRPDYEPESVGYIIDDENNNTLYTRATNWGYPPGSTFKILTAAAAYENGMKGTMFNDTGGFEKDNMKIANYGKNVYGNISLEKAFSVSSNQVFGEVAYELGEEKMRDIAERFGFETELEFDFPMRKSSIGFEGIKGARWAEVGIGQGEVETTPLHMAMICSAIANGGKLVQPYVVESVSADERVVKSADTKVIGQPITKDCADYIGELMVDVVKNGTGTRAQISGVTVAGKTGTAETGDNKGDHAWFVGYAPAENPQIAVAVVLENDGTSGGSTAAPMAAKVMKKYLSAEW